MRSLDRFPAVARFLAGEPAAWVDLGITGDQLIALCDAEELTALVYERSGLRESTGWPAGVRDTLAARARQLAIEESLRGAETRKALAALVETGVRPILIKGTALAYGWYDTPVCRPRNDTDLLIGSSDVDRARNTLIALGYTPTLYCHDLFSQFEVQKIDGFGVLHACDVHWKISTQPVFADVLTYDEMLPRAVALPALGDAAVAASTVDALLLACIHPVMHHRNAERWLWAYDVHLLASHLAPAEFDDFARLSRRKKVAAIASRGLRHARDTFGTAVPDRVIAALEAAGASESSRAYLASERRWHHELGSSLRGTTSLAGRARMLRQVLCPSPRYMLGVYGLADTAAARCLLPALYIHRNVRGAWKIVTGKK